jgi:diadenosine tetraphosphate (Ap4A) HIT family hydrolase
MKCFLCQKHAGEIASPPGGYFYDDLHWMVCHAPVDKGPLGTLFIESQRHFLDFAELLPDEAASYGILLKKLFTELKLLTSAERIYQVIMMEGVPHFHAWLVPRVKEISERGITFLEKDFICKESDVQKLVVELREALKQS